MRKRSQSRSRKGHITVAEARRLARVAKAKRAGRPSEITSAKWERYLGHFGPPVSRSTANRRGSAKKVARRGAKKASRRRAA